MQFRHPRAVVLLFGGIILTVQVAFWLTPHAAFSQNEKRVLADLPVLNLTDLADGSLFRQTEDYIADHFPGRDGWVGANAALTQAEGRGATEEIVCGTDGWLFPAPVAVDGKTMPRNLQAIAAFAEQQSAPVTLLAVPSAGAVVEHKLPRLHLPYPDRDLLAQIRELAGDSVRWVDVLADFTAAEQPEALYYRTDHHWTSEGAYRAYRLLMQADGKTPAPRETFSVERVPDFYGTSYSKSGLWWTDPDMIELWTDPGLSCVTSVYDGNQEQPVTQQGMLFYDYLEQADKYPVFLSGNHARIHIETNADSDRRLLVIKDSYAHALAPFLAEEYAQIDLIDLRYFKQQTVSEWLKEHPADAILLVYGINSLVQDKNLQWLA